MSSDKNSENDTDNKINKNNAWRNSLDKVYERIDKISTHLKFISEGKYGVLIYENSKKSFKELLANINEQKGKLNKDIVKDLDNTIDSLSSKMYNEYKNLMLSKPPEISISLKKNMIIKLSLISFCYILFKKRIHNSYCPNVFKFFFIATSMYFILM